jgi:hypothetical protein
VARKTERVNDWIGTGVATWSNEERRQRRRLLPSEMRFWVRDGCFDDAVSCSFCSLSWKLTGMEFVIPFSSPTRTVQEHTIASREYVYRYR